MEELGKERTEADGQMKDRGTSSDDDDDGMKKSVSRVCVCVCGLGITHRVTHCKCPSLY